MVIKSHSATSIPEKQIKKKIFHVGLIAMVLAVAVMVIAVPARAADVAISGQVNRAAF
jgi:hypothetical protein